MLQPIVINENNELIDGQRRIKAYIQLGINEIPFYRVNLNEIILGEFHANSNRKEFTTSERVAISNAIEELFSKYSRSVGRPTCNQKFDKNIFNYVKLSPNSTNGGNENNVVNLTTFSGRIKDNVSCYFGISRNTLRKEKEIVNAAEQNPEAFEELRKKVDLRKISVDKAFHQIQKQTKRAEILASARSTTSNTSSDNVTLLHGDFRQLSKTIPNDSIDLIFTDPPYDETSVPMYQDLANLAMRVLKDNASIITYVPNTFIPNIVNYMIEAGLKYWWTLAVKLEGSFARQYQRQISIKWKPLLWFAKGQRLALPNFMSDLIISNRSEKVLHDWEQSTVEAEHVFRILTVENQKILDPFVGAGSSAIAAINLNRKFIGIDIDPGALISLRVNIQKSKNNLLEDGKLNDTTTCSSVEQSRMEQNEK